MYQDQDGWMSAGDYAWSKSFRQPGHAVSAGRHAAAICRELGIEPREADVPRSNPYRRRNIGTKTLTLYPPAVLAEALHRARGGAHRPVVWPPEVDGPR